MFDGKACVRPGMKDTGLRKKVVSQLFDPTPGHPFWLRRRSERRQRSVRRCLNACSARLLVGTAWYAKKPVAACKLSRYRAVRRLCPLQEAAGGEDRVRRTKGKPTHDTV